jgi:hypothetical protein
VPTRWQLLLTAGVLMLIAVIALSFPTPAASAEHSCSAGCKAAYGSCYKSSQDRTKCQAQLQRCLETCIRKRHHSSATAPHVRVNCLRARG